MKNYSLSILLRNKFEAFVTPLRNDMLAFYRTGVKCTRHIWDSLNLLGKCTVSVPSILLVWFGIVLFCVCTLVFKILEVLFSRLLIKLLLKGTPYANKP